MKEYMKKTLFVCNTPYQILFAINYTLLNKDESLSVVLTDACNNYELLYDRLKKAKIFKQVYLLKLTNIPQYSKLKQIIIFFKQKLLKQTFLKKYIHIEGFYDSLYFANFNIEIAYLRRDLLLSNPKLTTYMFEDGFATYSNYYEKTLFDILNPNNFFYKFTRKMIYDIFYSVKEIVVFHPEHMQWNWKEMKISKIRFLGNKNGEFIDSIKAVFDIENLQDKYSQKYIFFEESFPTEGKDIGDVEIVEKIASIVGKENLFIKTHPRNRVNRFADLGYRTNKDSTVPWEVIALLIPVEKKVLITISSVAVLTPQVLLELKYQGVMLYKCINNKRSLRSDIVMTYENVINAIDSNVIVPNDLQEFECFLTDRNE